MGYLRVRGITFVNHLAFLSSLNGCALRKNFGEGRGIPKQTPLSLTVLSR